MLQAFADSIIDFLFPKLDEVYTLESLSPAELLTKLLPAREDDSTISIFNYADPHVRELVWELKYRRNTTIARTLAIIIYDVLRQELAERTLTENFSHPLLVPIPMSKERLIERGWNQTDVVCDILAALDTEHTCTYAPDILTKIRHTESQARTRSKRERLANIEGAMSVPNPKHVHERNIIIFDDVMTTGATLREARRALRDAGAKKILALTIAH